MSEMIQRVATALFLAEGHRHGAVPPRFIEAARVAIEATGWRDLLEEARDSLATGPSEAEVHRSGILARIDAALTE